MNPRSKQQKGLDTKSCLSITALLMCSLALSVALNAQEVGGLFSEGARQSMVIENGAPAMKFISKDGSIAFVYFRKYGSEDSFAINVIDWDNFKLKTGWLHFTSSRIVFESDDSEKRSFDISRTDAKLKVPKSGLKFFTIKVSGNEKRFMINFLPRLPAPWGKHQGPVFDLIQQLMTNYDEVAARFQEAATKLNPKADAPRSETNASTSLTQAKDQESRAVVEVSSEPPGAEIYVDGVFTSSTPSKLSLSQGEHSIRVSRPGFKDWERRLVVDSTSSKTLNAILDKAGSP